MRKMILIPCVLITAALLCWMVMPVSAVTSVVIGETVPLSGKGGGYDDMYLFLTGPNLAPGGVRLDSITSPVVSGTASSFTRAPVRNGVWEYEWNTGRTGGTLDPGTYLVWVSPEPLDRSEIYDTSYATIGILLTNPVLTAEISGNSDSQEYSGVEADVTVEETSGTGALPPGDEEISGVPDGDADEAQGSSGAPMPQSTTAGYFSYPFICVAVTGLFLLLTPNRITTGRGE